MIPTTFGNSPELLLYIFAMRTAEDRAGTARARLARTRRASRPWLRRWVGAIRAWALVAQHFPPSDAAPSRMT